jgi:hypothetical protein
MTARELAADRGCSSAGLAGAIEPGGGLGGGLGGPLRLMYDDFHPRARA